MDTIPKGLTPSLLAFCKGISPERPVFIPSKSSSDAKPSACFDNVERKISRAGGEAAYGWAIWHVPNLYFEAEHHGVWRNRQKKLIDVSPQVNSASEILFLPDPTASYDPKRFRPNILGSVDDSEITIEFARLATERNTILDQYRVGKYTVATLSIPDQAEITRIERRLTELARRAGLPF